MDSPTNSYAYKAGVRDKVKEIESRLSALGNSSQSQDEPVKEDFKTITLETSQDDDDISLNLSNSKESSADEKLELSQQNTDKLEQLNRDPSHNHLNKQPVPKPLQIKSNVDVDTAAAVLEVVPPIPVPRKVTPRRPQTLQIQNAVVEPPIVISTSPPRNESSSVSSTRRSSIDDGFADMASESDPFDDSTMPLPKIRENSFFLKDRRRSHEDSLEGDGENVVDGDMNGSFLHLTPSPNFRRGSLNPLAGSPRLQRTRTDSTNSAENYCVQQISSDMNRRESEAEVTFDLLQSKGSPQLSSPVGSPVIVRSKTLSNSTASILILGLPQSGKSSTINSLVQAHVASKHESTTSAPEIVEYTAKIKILDSSNLFNLKIVETPGYSNDPTITSDAQLLTTLVSYMESKEGFRGKPPTIVLVVLRFDDKRLWNPEDEHPDIVNFLKLINNFQSHLNDNKYANFVFVLTHFFGKNTSEHELRKPQNKIVELINLIQKYTSLPHPIMVVCAENENRSWSKDKHSGEERRNSLVANDHSFTVTFPTGETYPYNLIDRIKILLTKKGRDSVGETVLRTAFGIEYPYSIKECRVTKRLPMIQVSHPTVQQMQKTLLHAYLDIERTEIFTLLEIGWENIDKKIRDKHPDSLFTVQQIFQTKKVRKFEDIPEDPRKILNLVRQMPSNLAVKDLLIDTLQLKVPACYPALYIGQGFDLSKDATTNVSPFQFTSDLKTSPVGLIPNELDCKIRDDREIGFKFFYAVEEYITERLKDMNLRYAISANSLPAMSSSYKGQYRRGYNLIRKNQEPTKTTVATAMIEYRVFQLNLPQHPELQFKPQFWDTVQELPDLDINDQLSVIAWKDFFGYWGTHVVKSAFGGGSVEITFRGNVLNKIFHSMGKDFILPSDEYDTTRVFQWITGDGLDFVASCGKDFQREFIQGYDVDARFRGGDIKFQSIDLTKLESKEKVAEVREEWKESLVSSPVMLETNLVLVPLSHFVREKSEGIATKIDVALHYFYSDFMVTHGKQSSCTIL